MLGDLALAVGWTPQVLENLSLPDLMFWRSACGEAMERAKTK